MNRAVAALLFPAALGLGACATAPGPSRGSGNVITAAELQEVVAMDAYQAVQRLRPAFLRRGRVNYDDTVTYPIVYMDGRRLGGIDELHRIRASELIRIEFLNAADATTMYGTGHTGGALLLTSLAQGGD